MAERQMPFSLDLAKFQEARGRHKWFNLQDEFKTQGVSLSQSLLIWEEGPEKWLLADFENKKTYDINEVDDKAGNPKLEVSERPSEAEQPVTLEDAELILDYLKSAQGTDQGFIDFLKRLNFDELDLERLKRSDLSGAGFSFERVHPDLLIIHNMLREILTSPREWLLNLSREVVQDFVSQHLPQFYESVRTIEYFEISDENPRERHANLLQKTSNFCGSVKEPLGRIITYLSSKKIEQLAATVDATTVNAVERLKTETNRAEEINNEAEKKQAAMQQEFDRLKLEMQNQLAEESVSEYKGIFEDQAKRYKTGAWIWLGMAGVATVVFFVAFGYLSVWLKSEGSGLTGALQNLFTKGFCFRRFTCGLTVQLRTIPPRSI